MAIFKCKMCGGNLDFTPGDKIATCESCGTKQTLPSLTNDERIDYLYSRANVNRMENEFDIALTLYNQILAENSEDAECYWDMVLCEYGVTYVEDPKTGLYIPTCNRTIVEPIQNNNNYINALKYATPEQAEMYQADAEYIGNIQKQILDIVKSEKPFDIFVCYKELDSEGNRTRDSIKAQEIYTKLTEIGYKVFFSRITLEDKVGTEYEPYIYAALASSKIMLHITSSKENSESPWVKNEWSRFLTLSRKSVDKTFIPIYINCSADDMPKEFEGFASFDFDQEDFFDELFRGVRKLIPTPIMKLQKRKRSRIVAGAISAALIILIAVGALIALPRVKSQLAYNKAKELYASGDYAAASEAFELLGNYRDSAQLKIECDTMPEYEAAQQLVYDKNYPAAMRAFAALGDFKDAPEKAEQAENSWRKSVATLICDNDYIIDDSDHSMLIQYYYIDTNGNADGIYPTSTGANEISIDEHGKVISIACAPESDHIWALHDDGKVTGFIGELDENEWHDIIKISSLFNHYIIALRSDGKLLIHNEDYRASSPTEYAEYLDLDSLISYILSLENVVDFYAHDSGQCAFFAVRDDGTVEGFFTNQVYRNQQYKTDEILKNFKSIRSISWCSKHYYDTFGASDYWYGDDYDIFAITQDNRIVKSLGGKYVEEEGTAVSANEYFTLSENGELQHEGKIYFSDVVYLDKEFFITKTGKVYRIISNYSYSTNNKIVEFSFEDTGKTTAVYKEISERLK